MVRSGVPKLNMSSIRRFFVDKIGKETLLEGEEYVHAKNVLRLGVGDEVVLLDGSGKEYDAIISGAEKGALVCNVTGECPSDKESATPVKLLAGVLKGDKTELIVQKATELGVSEIGVFVSRYSSAYMNENKLERLKKVAREAAKQCLRARVPEITFYPDLKSALESCAAYKNKLFACEFARKSDADISSLSGPCALTVGSEGGFSEEEFDMARSLGFAGISLGKRILRAETAAIAFTAVVMFALGELR